MDNVQEFNEDVLAHNIISQRSPVTGNTLFYVLVHKESQSGLLYNQRLLVIEDKTFSMFYTKYIRPIDRLMELEKKGVKPIKEYVSILNTTSQIEDEIITIRFIKGKIKKAWFFRFHDKKLAVKWLTLYKELHQKSISKSLKSKDTAQNSNNLSEYASILSHNKYYQSPNNIQEEIEKPKSREKHLQKEIQLDFS